MRPPPDEDLYAPEFPKGLDWWKVAFLRMDRLIGQHGVLVEFWDFARINSLRTLPYLVACDPPFAVWRQYGNRGWPGRYVFDRRGILRYFHYGEGDYDGTEEAIQEVLLEIDPDAELPAPLEPFRPADAPGAL